MGTFDTNQPLISNRINQNRSPTCATWLVPYLQDLYGGSLIHPHVQIGIDASLDQGAEHETGLIERLRFHVPMHTWVLSQEAGVLLEELEGCHLEG